VISDRELRWDEGGAKRERQSKSDLREKKFEKEEEREKTSSGPKEKILKYCMPELQCSLKKEKHCNKKL
jgi:hypothetical protein